MPDVVIDPAPLEAGTLRIIPIGGLGEVGRNMTSFEIDGKILIVDCGVLFPEEHQPGVDLILPDFGFLKGRLEDIVGVVLTHGHEDHIGSVPYLLKLRGDIPLIGSQLTLALIEAKLKEHRIQPYSLTVKEGGREQIGPFSLEFIAVNHSIPDALAVAIKTDSGNGARAPATSRWTSCRSTAASPTCASSRASAKRASTSSWSTPRTRMSRASPRSSASIGPVLDEVINRAPRRVIVASFSSHVHRVQQVLDAAWQNHRRVALLGRSMVRNMTIAADLGYLKVPEGVLIDYKKAGNVPDEEIVYMSTGLPGRADGRALAHGQPRPPDRDRRGRHGDPRFEPDPRQRERGLPRHRRTHEARCERRAQGATRRCTSRVTPLPASCSTATTS